MKRTTGGIKKTVTQAIMALILMLGIVTLSPDVSEASRFHDASGSQVQDKSVSSISGSKKIILNLTAISFTKKSVLNRGQRVDTGIANLHYSNGLTTITNAGTVVFEEGDSNYVEINTTTFSNSMRSSITKVTVHLETSMFNKTIADYKKAYNVNPNMIRVTNIK